MSIGKSLIYLSLLANNCLANMPYFAQQESDYQSSINYGNNTEAGKYVRSEDADIYYEVYGSGDPIVLLHGGMVGSIAEMGQLIDALSQDYRVIAVSTRGHGRSSAGTKEASYLQKANDINQILLQEQIDKVSLIGFSDGAYSGLYFAKQYPHHSEKLIAIGAGTWEKGWRDFCMPSEKFFALDRTYWQAQQQIRPNPEQTKDWYQQLCQYYQQVEIGADVFAQVNRPTLLLVGERDQNAPLNTVMNAYYSLPNAELGVIPNAPHSVLQSNFSLVFPMIKDFLQK